MSYKLTIIKYTDNPNYEVELAKYKEDTRYENGYSNRIHIPEPIPQMTERSLEVVLNDEEYEAIKKSVLETFK